MLVEFLSAETVRIKYNVDQVLLHTCCSIASKGVKIFEESECQRDKVVG